MSDFDIPAFVSAITGEIANKRTKKALALFSELVREHRTEVDIYFQDRRTLDTHKFRVFRELVDAEEDLLRKFGEAKMRESVGGRYKRFRYLVGAQVSI